MVVAGLKLRPMQARDREAAGRVGFAAWRSSDAFDPAYLDPLVIERVRGEFAVFTGTVDGDVMLAEVDGVIAGWGARDGEPHHISDLWVHPDWQGRGIGGALIGHFLEKMQGEKVRLATISTHARNAAAIRLYERHGFTVVWRGMEWSGSMRVELEKVKLERALRT